MKKDFTVYGIPKAKGRPRFAKRGKFISTYTPQETVNYENLIKLSYQTEIEEKKFFKGAIKADICAIFPIPKSASKKNREKMIIGEIPYTKKPDADNIAKTILDAINNIAFDDDSQINELHVTKIYGEQPRVEVSLEDNFNPIKPIFFKKEDTS